MKYAGKTAGYNWADYRTIGETAKELTVTPVLNQIQDYRRNWLRHVKRMIR
jgi:hypothetical protein